MKKRKIVRDRRKAVSILCAVLTLGALLINGCRLPNEKRITTVKIGITMYDEFDPFTATIAEKIQESANNIGAANNVNVSCEITTSNKSQLRQNDQVRDYINKGYDVICVNLVDRTDAMQIIDMAKKSDTPIIFFNRELVKEDLERFDKLYYVGANPEQSGKFQAEIITDALGDAERFKEIDFNHDGVIQYVMLEGEAGHQDALIRTKVSVEEIKAAGFEVEKLRDEIANWSREQAMTKMTKILAGYPWQIELVIANDDNIALGALDALENYGVPKLPVIVGVNGEKEVFENIAEGKIEGTVYNNGIAKGELIGRMAYSLSTTGELPEDINLTEGKYIYVPYEKVNRANLAEYMDRAVY